MRSWYLIFSILFALVGLYLVLIKGIWLLLSLDVFLIIAYINEVKKHNPTKE